MPDSGYAWWYVDALSEDARTGLTLIAFVGSVFSPFYRAARQRGGDINPESYCALNIAIYRRARQKMWVFSEWAQHDVQREALSLKLGASHLTWKGGVLTAHLSELTPLLKKPLKGCLRLVPEVEHDGVFALEPGARHFWRPFAPVARIEVELEQPRWSWRGSGYMDVNWGEEPLEYGFRGWSWTRLTSPSGTTVLFDITPRHAERRLLARHFSPSGTSQPIDPPALAHLPRTFIWGLQRRARCENGGRARVIRTVEDSPFYARTLITTRANGEDQLGVHEDLSLEHFASPRMQRMLPYRILRRSS